MVDQLNGRSPRKSRAWRVRSARKASSVARRRSGCRGTWKDLTDSVNSMAGNLTGQVRNIAEVTMAVANGDLSQKDHRRRPRRNSPAQETINTMVEQLRSSRRK